MECTPIFRKKPTAWLLQETLTAGTIAWIDTRTRVGREGRHSGAQPLETRKK
jgi:hypothetical protein